MALQRWVSGAFGLLLGAGAVCFARPASACTLPTCQAPVRLPASPYLPGNLVYFQVLGDTDPEGLSLRTGAGEPIAASIRSVGGDRVFAPEQPIAEGTAVVLEYSTVCFGEPARQTFELTTMAPGPIELDPASLVLEEQGVSAPGRSEEASFVRVRHWSGDANGNATPLMVHSASVDGVPVGSVDVNGTWLIEVRVPCRPAVANLQIDTCGNLFAAPPGVHRVEVSTHIVGAEAQPEPVGLEVEVQCPGATGGDPSVDPEPSTPDVAPDAGATLPAPDDYIDRDFEESDILPFDAPKVAPEASSSGEGCSLGAPGSALAGSWSARSGVPALLAIIAALGVARSRRRRG